MTGKRSAVSGERPEALRSRTLSARSTAYRLPFTAYPLIAAALLAVMISGCGTAPTRDPTAKTPSRPGGYYLDDGPDANPPPNLDRIPEAVPRTEPIYRGTSLPYVVMGRRYTPMTSHQPYRARGIATWYGRRYHGKPTASGEPYDMYGMTAAHTTLPIPSYARVTNLADGRSVVVRVNDRGPFVDGRIIDLSYTAAHRIGVLGGGSAMVEVESILPGSYGSTPAAAAPARTAAAAPMPESPPAAAARDSGPQPAITLAVPEPPQAPQAAQPKPVATVAGGVFLQLGAFRSSENAENFLARMKTQLVALSGNLHIFTRDDLYRVHAGPYASQHEARQAAERINQALGVRPVVVTR
mgnify:CR=1 FL=1